MIYKHALICRCVGAKPTAGAPFRDDGAAARFRSAAHSILRYISKFRIFIMDALKVNHLEISKYSNYMIFQSSWQPTTHGKARFTKQAQKWI